MQYNCDDILRILSSGNDPEVDDILFDRHLENCPRCAALCDPGPELESTLRNSLSHTVPADFEKQLRHKLMACENGVTGTDRMERLIPHIVILMSSAFIAALIIGWKYLRGILDLNSLMARGSQLFGSLKLPSIESVMSGTYIVNALNFLFGLMSIVAVIWLFSILEYNRISSSKAGA